MHRARSRRNAGITPEYGEYLTYSCKVCHGLAMSGGRHPRLSLQLAARAQPDLRGRLGAAQLDGAGFHEHPAYRQDARRPRAARRLHALEILPFYE